MNKLNPEEFEFILRTLMQQAARDRVEIYALRVLLLQSAGMTPKDFAAAHAIASKHYETLLRRVNEYPESKDGLLELLKSFEGPVQ